MGSRRHRTTAMVAACAVVTAVIVAAASATPGRGFAVPRDNAAAFRTRPRTPGPHYEPLPVPRRTTPPPNGDIPEKLPPIRPAGTRITYPTVAPYNNNRTDTGAAVNNPYRTGSASGRQQSFSKPLDKKTTEPTKSGGTKPVAGTTASPQPQTNKTNRNQTESVEEKPRLETTTMDRSIITVPFKTCPEGQRMGPDRNCKPIFSDPEGR